MRTIWWVVYLWACDNGARPRTEGELDGTVDVGQADAARLDLGRPDAARPDLGSPDLGRPDLGRPDPDLGGPDAALPDRGLDVGATDGAPADGSPDAAAHDAAPTDGSPPDGQPDLGGIDAEVPVPTELFGEAHAADQRIEVTVQVGDQTTQTVGGAWRLAVPAGRWTVTFSAPEHETLTQDVVVGAEGAEVPPVLLYRGTRLGGGAGGVIQFTFDSTRLVWSEGDSLWTTLTAEVAPQMILEAGLELFLGYTPGDLGVAFRRRTEPAVAGDIDVITLADGARQPLFQEAQPWVRWLPDGGAQGMVQTQAALSRLVQGRPGARAEVLAEGVPWLLVTDLADGTTVWAQRDGDAFAVWARTGDGMPRPLAPGFPCSDAFLGTTPGRTGVFWLAPDGRLIRWEPAGVEVLARDVLASPRPRFLGGGRLIFFRADEAGPGLTQIFVLEGGRELRLVEAAEGNSLVTQADRWYATRPDDGLWTGDWAGGRERLLPGGVVRFVLEGRGVLALVDGAAWQAVPGGAATPLGVEGLSQLASVSTGATAWQPANRTLWYLPGPERALDPAPLVRGVARGERLGEPGGRALYVLGPQGFFRAPIPPGPATTPFDVEVTTLVPVDEARLLGWVSGETLHQIDPRTGEAFGWAEGVSRVVTDFTRQRAVYVSDRGTYLANMGPTP